MKHKWVILILAALLLCGCEKKDMGMIFPAQTEPAAETAVDETVPATVPADGNPEDVTCKGSYTGPTKDVVVATSGSCRLTNEQLQVWYWAEVAQYRQENHEIAPDFDRPLDTQVCEIDASVNSWQQYFLKQALSAWHSAQALNQHSERVPLTFEEAYQPNRVNTEKYMTGMPASEVLYGYTDQYKPNSMHRAYLEELPRTLETLAAEKGYPDVKTMAREAFGASQSALEAFADSWNRGYMYFTHLSYAVEPTAEELDAFCAGQDTADEEMVVDFRQILLIPEDVLKPDERPLWQQRMEPREPEVQEAVQIAPDGKVSCSEEAWRLCEEEAQGILSYWRREKGSREAYFGEIAHNNTRDTGTMVNGGRYQGIRKGQMLQVIDQWCFDPARQAGDTGILRSEYGVHILYFSGSRSLAREAAEQEYYRQQQNQRIEEAKKAFPMEVAYQVIQLQEAQALVSAGELLYPDIAHERFPEVPLYLQQDYPSTMYGGFKITTNGCGITSFAMVASYLADEELTPPEMCDLYGNYSHANGTDGLIFNNESAVMGFYLREKTYDIRAVKQALEDGYLVVSIQHPGYWTRGGHYIVLERIAEDGRVQVRDSNIYNYMRVSAHKEDLHKWGHIIEDGSGYWIFDYKITRIPACSRCGNPEGITEKLLTRDYICEKCSPAMLRRSTYLDA